MNRQPNVVLSTSVFQKTRISGQINFRTRSVVLTRGNIQRANMTDRDQITDYMKSSNYNQIILFILKRSRDFSSIHKEGNKRCFILTINIQLLLLHPCFLYERKIETFERVLVVQQTLVKVEHRKIVFVKVESSVTENVH